MVGVKITLTPETQERLRSRGISHSELIYAFNNYTSSIPSKKFHGDHQLIVPRGAGRLYVVFREMGEGEVLVLEAWWNPRP